jgi:hypothetical protein
MKNKLKEITEQYFSSFESKDIMSLEKLFDKEIKLFDPVIKEVIGKDKVIEANKNIFNGCEKIIFTKKNIYVDSKEMTTVGEIEFYVDKLRMNVVDIIKFNVDFKIISINAYFDTEALNV